MDRGMFMSHGQGLHLSPAKAITCKSRSSLSIQVTFRGKREVPVAQMLPKGQRAAMRGAGMLCWRDRKVPVTAGSLQQGSFPIIRGFNL